MEIEIFEQVYKVILERKASLAQCSANESYVASLMHKGADAILKKIGEEAAEVIIATKNTNRKEQIHEITDLWFHLMLLMGYQEITLVDISQELQQRFGQSGLEEKSLRTNT